MENKTEVTKYKDLVGNDVSVGDWIVYGHLLDRSAGIKVGRVLKIETLKDSYGRDKWAIRVAGAERSWWDGKWSSTSPGTLKYPDRTLRIEPSNMSDDVYFEILNLLEPEIGKESSGEGMGL